MATKKKTRSPWQGTRAFGNVDFRADASKDKRTARAPQALRRLAPAIVRLRPIWSDSRPPAFQGWEAAR